MAIAEEMLYVELNGERLTRLNEDMARIVQFTIELRQTLGEQERRIALSERRLAESERLYTLAEERMSRHEERMEEFAQNMKELNRDVVQTRKMFIRACERLGLFDDDESE